jgi:hypothetical protein
MSHALKTKQRLLKELSEFKSDPKDLSSDSEPYPEYQENYQNHLSNKTILHPKISHSYQKYKILTHLNNALRQLQDKLSQKIEEQKFIGSNELNLAEDIFQKQEEFLIKQIEHKTQQQSLFHQMHSFRLNQNCSHQQPQNIKNQTNGSNQN